jgi:tripartite ATP-independent transporter DctP family solute receptor
MRKLLTSGIAVVVLGALAMSVAAQPKYVLRFSSPNSKEHAWGRSAEKFKQLVGEETRGQVEVQVYHANALGATRESLEMTRLGSTDFVLCGVAHVSRFVPEMSTFVLPYLWKDTETMFKALDGRMGDTVDALLWEKGFKVVGWWDNGFRHISNNKRPIRVAEDIKGLKLRSLPTKIHVTFWRALGASPTPMDWAEVYPALQQGVVDGQEHPLVNIHASKLYEVQKHLALTSHMFQMTPFLMSKRSWDKLSEADRKAVTEAAAEATALQRRLSQEADDKLLADLKSKGVQVTTPDKAGFEKATSNVDDKWAAGPIGPYVKKVIAAARGQ